MNSTISTEGFEIYDERIINISGKKTLVIGYKSKTIEDGFTLVSGYVDSDDIDDIKIKEGSYHIEEFISIKEHEHIAKILEQYPELRKPIRISG